MASINENRDRVGDITKMTKEIADIAHQLNRLAFELRTPVHLVEDQVHVTTKIEDEIKTLASHTKQVKQDLEEIIQERPLSMNEGLEHPESTRKVSQRAQVSEGRFKINAASARKVPRWRQYAEWVVGKVTLLGILKYELIIGLFGSFPGALGYYLRSKLYPWLLGEVGSNTVFGRALTLRHPHKIRIGKNVTIDDYCVLDAKGQANEGIQIGDDVYVGRSSIVYCKDGDIEIQSKANIGSHCEIFSGDRVVVGNGSMVAADCYIMSGNSYDYESEVAFADQKVSTKGATTIGQDCWLGTKVVVLDGVSVGDGAVVGAGAVVTKTLSSRTISMGLPARSVSSRESKVHA